MRRVITGGSGVLVPGELDGSVGRFLRLALRLPLTVRRLWPSRALMKIVRFAADELLVRRAAESALRLDQDHVLGVLHLPFDDEKRLFRDQQAAASRINPA